MTSQTELLRPVILFDPKAKTYKTKKLKDSKLLASALLQSNYYIKTDIIPKSDFYTKAIVAIELPLEKHKVYTRNKTQIFKDSKLVCRIKVIQRDSLGNPVLLYQSSLTPIDTGEKELLPRRARLRQECISKVFAMRCYYFNVVLIICYF